MITHMGIHVIQYLSKVTHDFKQISALKKVNHFGSWAENLSLFSSHGISASPRKTPFSFKIYQISIENGVLELHYIKSK